MQCTRMRFALLWKLGSTRISHNQTTQHSKVMLCCHAHCHSLLDMLRSTHQPCPLNTHGTTPLPRRRGLTHTSATNLVILGQQRSTHLYWISSQPEDRPGCTTDETLGSWHIPLAHVGPECPVLLCSQTGDSCREGHEHGECKTRDVTLTTHSDC